MADLIGIAIILIVCSWFYTNGKRVGSRKGYGVGRTRGRW